MAALRATSEPTLGIIGGAGVGAAAALYVDVSARVRAATGRLPKIALWNLPLSDAIEHAFTAAEPDVELSSVAEALVADGVERLIAAGATVIAMPCNSLQRVAARETERAQIPFIDMIGATIDAARDSGAQRAVLIATEATLAGGVYEGRGIEIVAPPDATRAQAVGLIMRAVQGPPPNPAELADLVEEARRPQACVVLGCTDICGLLGLEAAAQAGVIESLRCLAERCAEALRLPAAVG